MPLRGSVIVSSNQDTNATAKWFAENMPGQVVDLSQATTVPQAINGDPTRPYIPTPQDDWYLDAVGSLPANTSQEKARRTRLQKRGLKARF